MSEPNQTTPPQRFRWRDSPIRRWKFGVCLWNCTHEVWEIHTFGYCNVVHFDEDPLEVIGQVVGDAYELDFIDNDFGWTQGVPWAESDITDEQHEAAKAAERREHAIGKAEYLRERAKDGER